MKELKNLRVAVVEVDKKGDGINQDSDIVAILGCPNLQLFTLPDYFSAQNNEELDFSHWSFLIDIENMTDLTGINIDGVDYNRCAF